MYIYPVANGAQFYRAIFTIMVKYSFVAELIISIHEIIGQKFFPFKAGFMKDFGCSKFNQSMLTEAEQAELSLIILPKLGGKIV